jgi:hypothetical protein
MTNLEIKEKIDINNKIIETILSPSEFTLNNTVRDLIAENAELQKQCTHNFVDGYCEFCYMEETK